MRRTAGTRTLLFASLLAIAFTAQGAERRLEVAPAKPAPGGERRLALVIGNAAYKISPLRNPVNDARAIARSLAATGFRVTVVEDASQALMWRAIRDFGDELTNGGGVGLFYYAGHGMQVRGKNYLIPVNADIQREDEVEFHAVDANLVLAKMDSAKNALNLMILDACRNNPFARGFRSAAQGLAQMDAPSGTLVAFATAPGSVASDGDGENGLYTKHLLATIARPGLAIEHVFKEVRRGVSRETADRQIPWESSSLRGDFYFVAPDPGSVQQEMEKRIQEALARQRAEFEERLRRERGERVAEVKPAPAAPQPSLQLASTAPSSIGTGIADARFPRVGDTWSYTYTDATTKRSRPARFVVEGVSKEGILESGGLEGQVGTHAHGAGAQLLIGPELWEFSPFMLTFGGAAPGTQWDRIVPMKLQGSCGRGLWSCSFKGRVAGSERVEVPAGTFEATKVVVDMTGGVGSHLAVRQLTYWYAERAKRVVKTSVRTLQIPSYSYGTHDLQTDYDVVLTSFKLH